MGVWIETHGGGYGGQCQIVTPCVGVWIETDMGTPEQAEMKSHPAWVCGLKPDRLNPLPAADSHTLRGCVD